MTAESIVRSYSDETLAGIVRQLSVSGDWPARLRVAINEIARRRATLRR